MDRTLVFEHGDRLYLVAGVTPFDPDAAELDELAFAQELRQMAPNEHLGWLRGQYVEADRPNDNGAMWSSDELAIKSLTPMLMPVTVMHDPRTAVGMIADTRLLTPDADKVPRARIDTTLGIWRHRFPEVWDEVAANYTAGTLMQSMECRPAYYDCGECGRRFPKLPGGAEKANWCAHLRGEENAKAIRRLGGVTFTGTGLIFGTRGARGALDTAHLEVFQEEVAEFHERAQRDTGPPQRRRQRSMDTIEIKRDEYDSLKAAAARTADLEKRVSELEESATKVPDLEKQVEKLEVDVKAAQDERDEEKAKREALEETARQATLADERKAKLGAGFLAKLPESIKGRLDEQARKLSDEQWSERLDELAELVGVKPDEDTPAGGGGDTFSREEVARSQFGAGGSTGAGTGEEPSPQARRSVVGGLLKAVK